MLPGHAEGGSTAAPAVWGRWSREEDTYLRANPDAPAGVAAAHLGRTVAAVPFRRGKLAQQEGTG